MSYNSRVPYDAQNSIGKIFPFMLFVCKNNNKPHGSLAEFGLYYIYIHIYIYIYIYSWYLVAATQVTKK